MTSVREWGWSVLDAYVARYLENLQGQVEAGQLTAAAAYERAGGLQMWLDQVHAARRAGQMHPSWRWELWFDQGKANRSAGKGRRRPDHRSARLVILCATGPAEELGIHVPAGRAEGIAAAMLCRHLMLSDGSPVPTKTTLAEMLRQAETAAAAARRRPRSPIPRCASSGSWRART